MSEAFYSRSNPITAKQLEESLVRMKLTSFRRKDQVHVLDMIEVGLIDATWVERLETSLGQRLQELLDDPFG